MAQPTKLNLTIYQGSTFAETIRWEGIKKVYKTITAISQAAPCIISSTAHGVPDGWRIKVSNVVGMKEINDSVNYKIATVTNANSIELNDINSLGYTAYVSGGVIEYQEPKDLTGYTARMQIRAKLADVTPLVTLTESTGIVINNTNKTITIGLTALATAAFTWTVGVYSLELVDSTGTVTTLLTGNVSVKPEVTR